ncbi:glucose/mannose transport system permease protein [Halarchaeum rubridurum]|uniref:Glucose/mannose transport system permease protein n=1 Tax=Halarchaeum rubridurum TaxID=489911 RepID=A0A830G3L2_9EURY|nr:sugar ABC transporter permease [Halarchaeum rubridurum]MBP1955605.1 glucose/mannose transport system permease protein [Halarchaeum rubridurum]GGM73682.1 sugar ABC transporter permease [Halarchaeum rubridurum]
MRGKLAAYLGRLVRRNRVRADGGEVNANATRDGFVSDEFTASLPYWLPPFVVMGLAVYGAILWNFFLSLTDTSGFQTPNYANLDFEMYAKAFADPVFIGALRNTFALLVAFTVLCLVVGLVVAVLVDQGIRYENTFRTIYLLPMALSFVVTAQFWLWMYNQQNGLVNIILGVVGLGPYEWIGNPSLVLGAVVFALIWQFSGYAMVVYLAGLRAIPTEQFEAARVDGATTLRMYWRVILPQLKGATISASVVLMVFALKAFDFLYSLTGSYYPPKGSDILATMMVRQAFVANNRAYAAAIGIMLFALALVIVAPYLLYQYRAGEL